MAIRTLQLGMQDRRGRIAPGFFADLAALERDPTKAIEAVYRVRWVMKDGVVVVDRRAQQSGASLKP